MGEYQRETLAAMFRSYADDLIGNANVLTWLLGRSPHACTVRGGRAARSAVGRPADRVRLLHELRDREDQRLLEPWRDDLEPDRKPVRLPAGRLTRVTRKAGAIQSM